MKKCIVSMITTACMMVLASALQAQLADPPASSGPQEKAESPRYDRLDADGDGRVSRTEFLGSIRDKKRWWQLGRRTANTDQNAATPEMFSALDRNRDGYLTNEELNSGQRLQESRGDNGEGASATRNVHPPGSKNSGQKSESETPADKRAQETK
jgi:hypothetical protein